MKKLTNLYFPISFHILLVSFSLVCGQNDNTLSEEEKKLGWELLFDGTTESILANWVQWNSGDSTNTNVNTAWQLDEDDNFLLKPGNGGGDLRTKKKYGDFVWKLEYRINRNQGLFYRASLCQEKLYQNAVEFAIDPTTSRMGVYTGAAYGIFPNPLKNAVSHESDDWDTIVIVAIKDSVEHYHNNIKVVSYRYWSPDFTAKKNKGKFKSYESFARNCTPDGSVSGDFDPESYPENGYLGIQGTHGGQWHIKNFKVLNNAVIGCMDPTKDNYNPNANFDIYAETLLDSISTHCGNGISVASKVMEKLKHDYHIFLNSQQLVVSLKDKNIYSIAVRSLSGHVVQKENVSGDKVTFNNLPSGVFFIEVKSSKKDFFSKKIVVF